MDQFGALFSQGGLSLERLRTLCLVANAGSLTAAAGGDLTRVSLFSRQMKELESCFGVRLARRRGRTLALTERGLELARLALAHLRALEDFQRTCAGRPAKISLGAGASTMEWFVMPRMAGLRAALRKTRITLQRSSSRELAEQLREMRLDVGIVRGEEVGKPLRAELLHEYGFFLCIPRALAGPVRSLAKWLPEVPMIAPAEGWTRGNIDAACASAGITLRYELEGAHATLSVRALREGQYGTFLPDTAEPELAGLDFLALRPAFLHGVRRRLCVAWNPRAAETRPVVEMAVQAILKWREPAG
jgi:DNA-binding transcriptional LysR family regulator